MWDDRFFINNREVITMKNAVLTLKDVALIALLLLTPLLQVDLLIAFKHLASEILMSFITGPLERG